MILTGTLSPSPDHLASVRPSQAWLPRASFLLLPLHLFSSLPIAPIPLLDPRLEFQALHTQREAPSCCTAPSAVGCTVATLP